MAPAFDAVGPSSSGADVGTSGPLTWSHTCGASATLLLVGIAVGVTSESPATPTVTYNGVAMTAVGAAVEADDQIQGWIQSFYLFSPPTGSAYTVSVTLGSTTNINSIAGGSISFTGASALGTPYTAYGDSATASVPVTSNTSGNIIAAFGGSGTSFSSATSPATSRVINNNFSNSGCGQFAALTIPATGSSVTAGWTITSDYWAIIAVEVQGSGGGGPTVTSVGTPQNTHSTTGSVTGTWGTGQTRTAGDLLLAAISCAASTSVTATATSSGWTLLQEVPNSSTAHVRVAIWYLYAVGSDSPPTFTSTETGTAGGMDCTLFELNGGTTSGSPLDVSATYASGSSTGTLSAMTATTAAVANTGEYAVSVFAQERAAGNLTFTDSGSGGFSKLVNGNGASSVLQTYVGATSGPSSGTTVNDAGHFSTDTTAYGAALVAVFAVYINDGGGNLNYRASGAITSVATQETSLSLTASSSLAVGDAVLVCVASESGNATQRTYTISGGGVSTWTAAGTQPARTGTSGNSYVGAQVFWGFVTTAGGGTFTCTCSSSEYMMAGYIAYYNTNATTPIDVYPTPLTYGATEVETFATPSGTTVALNDWIITFFAGNFSTNGSGTYTPPSGYTTQASSNGTDGQMIAVGDYEPGALAASSSFGGGSWGYSKNSIGITFSIAVQPGITVFPRHPKWMQIWSPLQGDDNENMEYYGAFIL